LLPSSPNFSFFLPRSGTGHAHFNGNNNNNGQKGKSWMGAPIQP